MLETLSLLNVRDLEVALPSEDGDITLVNKVSFSLKKGKTLGIVGESGCGKSLTSLSIMGLLPPNIKVKNGFIQLNGKDITKLSKSERRRLRGKDMAMIFQEPMTSLNPVYKIGYQIVELIRNHENISKAEARKRAIHMLELVGIPRPNKVIEDYPHQLSGGMRQRVMIGMALSCNPGLLIADEPTTALDVTIQAQIFDLMKSLQDKMHMSLILVTHDLGVVAEVCDTVIVMYAGEVVERTTVEELFESPKHPYTKGLLAALPKLEEDKEVLSSIPGTVPSPTDMPKGCRFADRCPHTFDLCHEKSPKEFFINEQASAKCWLYEEQLPRKSPV
ncbi:ABC transporter ATP-binding protein [Siminovitchia sp. 179-K 8D1 HS]|uniref:ABC transporter ATP-binding protein n=1 Tax=Siminovitchia sp. 179-K 8D1 HS TaxID=3142385 RepID=UPI0039A13A24